jgi:hypothetical protein
MCSPILATVRLHQLVAFVCSSSTVGHIDTSVQDIVQSTCTLPSRSTRNQRGKCMPTPAVCHLRPRLVSRFPMETAFVC